MHKKQYRTVIPERKKNEYFRSLSEKFQNYSARGRNTQNSPVALLEDLKFRV